MAHGVRHSEVIEVAPSQMLLVGHLDAMKGDGYVQPFRFGPEGIVRTSSMPTGSRETCGAGDSDTRPPLEAVGSPSRHAAKACIASCTVVEKRNATNQMKPGAKSACMLGTLFSG